jgi:hypothetical protein
VTAPAVTVQIDLDLRRTVSHKTKVLSHRKRKTIIPLKRVARARTPRSPVAHTELKGEERRAAVREMFGSEMFQRYPDSCTPEELERIDWVFRAYVGGKSDQPKQGDHSGVVYEQDISSAYPIGQLEVPDMTGGHWERVINPTRERVENANMVSMFHVRTHGYERDLPFYALPFRTTNGSIYYPPNVEGMYMRDHVIAAIRHYDYFEKAGRLCNYGINSHGPTLEIVSGWIFHPLIDKKPFTWIADLFDYRVKIKDTNKSGAQAIKLGLNSLYGKTAEGVGNHPPLYASPFFAAAITAKTQRMVIEAGLTSPDSVSMFATDGVYSTKALDVCAPKTKTLGAWEVKEVKSGGVFVYTGVYLLRYKPIKKTYNDRDDEHAHFKVKTRGFSPKEIDHAEGTSYNQAVLEVLGRDIPQYWARGEKTYDFIYSNYMALGISSVSRNSWKRIGQWKKKSRSLKLDATEGKRVLDRGTSKHSIRKRASRAEKLVNLNPAFLFPGCEGISARSDPKWLGRWRENEIEEESENVMAGLT